MTKLSCSACLFVDSSHANVLICRRHAPKPPSRGDHPDELSAYWPRVDATDWCAEHSYLVENQAMIGRLQQGS